MPQLLKRVTTLHGLSSTEANESPPYDRTPKPGWYAHLNHMLQATIDTEHLFDMFFFEAQQLISFDGIKFDNHHHNCHYCIGLQSEHRAHYRLYSNQDYVGELTISRNTSFSDGDLELLENLISTTIAPLEKALSYLEA